MRVQGSTVKLEESSGGGSTHTPKHTHKESMVGLGSSFKFTTDVQRIKWNRKRVKCFYEQCGVMMCVCMRACACV